MRKEVIAIGLIAVLIGVAFSSSVCSAEKVDKITIGWQPGFEHVAAVIAQEKGWWEEELGIPVELKEFPGGGAPEMLSFRMGEIQVAYVGVAPTISTIDKEYEKGHKIVAGVGKNIATLAIRATNGTSDFEWTGAESLKGKTIGVWGGPGSIQWTLTNDWLKANGVDPVKDVKIVTGGVGLMTMLKGKEIDAMTCGAEFDDLVRQGGYGVPVVWISKEWAEMKGYEASPCCVLVVHGDLINNNPELVEKIVKVHMKAQQYAMNPKNAEENVEIMSKHVSPEVKASFGGKDVWFKAVNASISHYLGIDKTYLGKENDGQLVLDPREITECGMLFAKALRETKPPAITRDLTEADVFDYSFYDKAMGVVPSPSLTPTATPTSPVPGFEAILAIAGLLSVAYLVMRRRK